MSDLTTKHCQPCEGDVQPMTAAQAQAMAKQVNAGWQVSGDAKSIRREWQFKNFYRTMSFVNAVAHIANTEDHHPDLEIGYNYCRLKFSTHSIGGLSENDFICAAKIDDLPTG